jgi:hypothetical protein
MKRVSFLLLIVCLCVGLSASAQIPRQRPVKPVPAVKVEGKVDQFLKVAQGAASIAEVRAAFNQSRFTQTELDQLKGKIEASSSLSKKIEQLQRQSLTKMKPKLDQAQRAAEGRFLHLRKQVTEKQSLELRAQALEIRQKTAGLLRVKPDPNDTDAGDTPAIEHIHGPITPGTEFAIEGQGLGSAPGSVDVMVGGRIFRAGINGWNSRVVYAQLERSVDGVREGNSTVVLETKSGKKSSGEAPFSPLLDVRYEKAPKLELMGYCCGNSWNWRIFEFKLENDWYVSETRVETFFVRDDFELSTSGDGHAEITSGPENYVGNVWATSDVHGGVRFFESMQIYVTLYIAGPKGLPHRF